MSNSLSLGAQLRRRSPGLYAVLSFHANQRYGRRLEELPPDRLQALARDVLGEKASLLEEVLEEALVTGGVDAPRRLQGRTALHLMVI